MNESMLMAMWLALAVSHGFNTFAVLWLLRKATRKYTINFKPGLLEYKAPGRFEPFDPDNYPEEATQ